MAATLLEGGGACAVSCFELPVCSAMHACFRHVRMHVGAAGHSAAQHLTRTYAVLYHMSLQYMQHVLYWEVHVRTAWGVCVSESTGFYVRYPAVYQFYTGHGNWCRPVKSSCVLASWCPCASCRERGLLDVWWCFWRRCSGWGGPVLPLRPRSLER